MRIPRAALAAVCFAAVASAQFTIVGPVGYANTEGNSNNAFPWNWHSSSIRTQFIYDGSVFTSQNVTGPALITQLRFRADGVNNTWTGGSYSNAVIDLSTCPLPYSAPSTNFNANHGADRTNVINGNVTISPGTSTQPGPGPWHITIPLTTPFLYDPTLGGITVDITLPLSGWAGGTTPQADHTSANGVTRIYDLTGVSPTGTIGTNYGAICEFTIGNSGYASTYDYGAGCYTNSPAFYEIMQGSSFDLYNSSMLVFPNGYGGFSVMPGISTFRMPTSAATNLGLGDDQNSSGLVLPFTISGPGYNTNTIYVESNGRIWFSSNNNTNYTATVSDLLTSGPSFCPYWTDLDPPIGGTVTAELDATSGNYYVTWLNVAQYYNSANTSTFQVIFWPNGFIETIWQSGVTTNPILVGMSPGLGVNDPGSRDVDVFPFDTFATSLPLQLTSSARPITNTTIALNSSNVPTNATLGVLFLSLTQYNPGIPGASLGAPGCSLFCGADAVVLQLPSGTTMSTSIPIPNNPGLSGVNIFTQSIALASGFNTLGAVSSNGTALHLGIN